MGFRKDRATKRDLRPPETGAAPGRAGEAEDVPEGAADEPVSPAGPTLVELAAKRPEAAPPEEDPAEWTVLDGSVPFGAAGGEDEASRTVVDGPGPSRGGGAHAGRAERAQETVTDARLPAAARETPGPEDDVLGTVVDGSRPGAVPDPRAPADDEATGTVVDGRLPAGLRETAPQAVAEADSPQAPAPAADEETTRAVVDRSAASGHPLAEEAAAERTDPRLPALPALRQPDVVFGPIVGADDETGPQPPLPVLMGLLGRPVSEDEATARDRGDVQVYPPISPILAEALYSPPRPRRRVGLVIPGVIATGLLVIGAVAALIWPDPPRAAQRPPAPAGTPTPSATAGAGISGVTPEGIGVAYETVEVSAGYFEGTLTLTNGTGETLPSWTLSFTYPGAYIRNVWGGELADAGNEVTITSDDETAPIAAGGSVEIRFGGGGTPSRPQNCTLGGTPCGF